MPADLHLLLFTRFPQAGTTKTRLIPLLGAEGAATLQKELTEKIADEIQVLKRQLDIKSSVYFCGGNTNKMRKWLGNSFDYTEQPAGDIGRKMRLGFTMSFHNGAQSTILIGSDIPDLSADIIKQGYHCLKNSEIVIGPSKDGGYYLIGCTAKHQHHLLPLLFDNMSWSNSEVLSITVDRLETQGITYTLLEVLQDIDCPQDIVSANKK